MDELKDNLIAGSGISATLYEEVLPNQKPKKFIDISDNVIDTVSIYMTVVLKMSPSAKHQDVNVKDIIINTKNMFRDGVKHNDQFWMQHTSSSIREIIGFVKVEAEDFFTAHSSIPPYARDQEIKDRLDKLVSMRAYFSDIVHFVPGNRHGLIHKLYPADGYGTMRKEKFFQEEKDIFEKVCIDLIYILNDIFVKYCVGVVSNNTSAAQATSAVAVTPLNQ